jgi:parallel beta-helix repeat protein
MSSTLIEAMVFGMRRVELRFRHISIVVLFISYGILMQSMCIGAAYYIDATNGNDRNSGLSPQTAWKRVAAVNRRPMGPGDSVLFKRGEVWRERLVVPSSGDAGAPITFAAYGTGERPEINGADVITGWSLHRDNIYVANVNSKVTQLFIDGNKQVRARWPNSGWLNIDADSKNRISLYSRSLIQQDNYWAGATIVMKTQPFWIEVRTVVSNSGHTISWNEDVEYGTPARNYGFFLEGKLEEIDEPGEWCYDAGKVYLMMNALDSPENHLIEGSVRDSGIEVLGKAYIVVDGFKINCPRMHGVYVTYPDHVYVTNNAVSFSEHGIEVYSPGSPYDYVYINSNSVSHTGQDAISVWGSNHCEITDNELTDVASDNMSPRVGNGIWAGSVDHLLISRNKIDRVAYNGIAEFGRHATVSHNTISNCLLLLADGGGIYTAVESSDSSITDNVINGVIGNVEGTPFSEAGSGAGIYLDEVSSGYAVAVNIVYDCDYGVFLHRAYDNTITNNSLYNNNKGMLLQEDNRDEMHDNNVYNNILLCTKAGQLTWYESAVPGSVSIVKGKYDYNLHYNPSRNDVIQYDSRLYTLNAWRAFSGQEERSIAADPLCVDIENHDFHLQNVSPCIDAGTYTGLSQDFDGNIIPQGNAPDIGPYEHGSTWSGYSDISRGSDISAGNSLPLFGSRIMSLLHGSPSIEAGVRLHYVLGMIPVTAVVISATPVFVLLMN